MTRPSPCVTVRPCCRNWWPAGVSAHTVLCQNEQRSAARSRTALHQRGGRSGTCTFYSCTWPVLDNGRILGLVMHHLLVATYPAAQLVFTLQGIEQFKQNEEILLALVSVAFSMFMSRPALPFGYSSIRFCRQWFLASPYSGVARAALSCMVQLLARS